MTSPLTQLPSYKIREYGGIGLMHVWESDGREEISKNKGNRILHVVAKSNLSLYVVLPYCRTEITSHAWTVCVEVPKGELRLV